MSELKKVEFRPATSDDYEFMGEMLATSFYWREKGRRWLIDLKTFEEIHPIEAAAYLHDFGNDEGDLGVIADTPKGPIGAAWAREVYRGYPYNGELIPGHSYEIACAVRYTARRRGIGRRLLHHLSESATEAGQPYLMLGVREDNTAARALYEQSGFVADKDNDGIERRVHGMTVPMIKHLVTPPFNPNCGYTQIG